ncbi:hypothetical protein DM02DRAFT_608584, partial [Periconia macrospinosa]
MLPSTPALVVDIILAAVPLSVIWLMRTYGHESLPNNWNLALLWFSQNSSRDNNSLSSICGALIFQDSRLNEEVLQAIVFGKHLPLVMIPAYKSQHVGILDKPDLDHSKSNDPERSSL